MRAADAMIPTPYVVRGVWSETHDVVSMELEPESDGALPPGEPGQFNMLWAFGVGEAPISISGGGEGVPLVHTIRRVGNVTRVLGNAQAGDVIGLRGPFGRGWPLERARDRDVVVIGGGIGLAPLRPVLYHLEANRGAYGAVTLLYGTRTPDDILFRSELEAWRGRFDFEVDVTVDAAARGWRSHVGAVTELVPGAAFDPEHVAAFVCGPEIMMQYAVRALRDRGVPTDSIHLSMERSMKCAVGLCGHCQWGADFLCKDGPVFPFDRIDARFTVRER